MTDADLYYFTNSYPYGIAPNWKHEELEACIDAFRRVIVVPLTDGGDRNRSRPAPSGVEVAEPLLTEPTALLSPQHLLRTVASPRMPDSLRELVRSNAHRRRQFFRSWARSTLQIERIARHATVREIVSSDSKLLVLYFFWGKGTAELAPWLRRQCPQARLVARFHRYDLYEDQSDGYIPFQRAVVDAVDTALVVSAHGLIHLRQLYPQHAGKMKLQRLGSIARGDAHSSTDGVTRLVSCSSITPVKRVPLIAEALRSVTAPVHWTHIGSGPEFSVVRDITRTFPPNIRVQLVGAVDPDQVWTFYTDKAVDLFINVSTSEGVPISIMEALSAGIPVVATSVGGTPEIVDSDVGELLDPNVTPQEVGAVIERYTSLSAADRHRLRVLATERHRERCDARILTGELVRILRGLPTQTGEDSQ